jgi:hypothetical protein
MFNILGKLISVVIMCVIPAVSMGFCGFYVAKADSSLFNEASKVVVAHHEGKTVITMASDYQGDAEQFAMVVPVPTVLQQGQIHVRENKLIDHLDDYTAPRLVEYFDKNPCENRVMYKRSAMTGLIMQSPVEMNAEMHGVKVEAKYKIDEYDISILSAKESYGLQKWLQAEGYNVPKKAQKVLDSYLKQGMKFFIAKINLKEFDKRGLHYLRPIQVAFESKRLMLPIRLGTVNAKGPQDMIVMGLTKKGRLETSNYRTVSIPSDIELPVYLKQEFNDFYPKMFDVQHNKENKKAVFLEYAWDMSWCDPCAADPLSREQLRKLGVFWLDAPIKDPNLVVRPTPFNNGSRDVYVTRLHVRYDAEHFPEDLMFNVTSNRKNFQGRYIIRHPWVGKATCPATEKYYTTLLKSFEKQAKNLANLIEGNYSEINKKMTESGQDIKAFKHLKGKRLPVNEPWWKVL